MLQNCLLVLPQSWCHQIFETDRRNVKRRTECLSEVFFLHVCQEESSGTSRLQKSPTVTEDDLGFTSVSFFGRRGRKNQRHLTPTILSLRRTLNRSQPGSLPATKNHQGGSRDCEEESDAKIFSLPDAQFDQQSASYSGV